MALEAYKEFIGGVYRNPGKFSTLFPTGYPLAKALVEKSSIKKAKNILELGVGSGAITDVILSNMSREGRLTGLERDIVLVHWLKEKYPDVRFKRGDAERLSKIFPGETFDLIFSSLPWTQMGSGARKRIVQELTQVLSKKGEFFFFITVHMDSSESSQKFKKGLEKAGFKIEKRSTIWWNLPPANLYRAVRKN